MNDDAPPPDPVPTPPIRSLAASPRAHWRRAARVAGVSAAAAVFAAAAGLVAAALVWRTEAGTRWLLRQLPGVTAVDVHGSLGGGDLRIGSLRTVQAAAQVDIAGLRVQGLALRVHPHPGQWLGVHIADWEAAAVHVQVTPSAPKGEPAGAPKSLRSPVALDVAHLHVGTLAIGDSPPLRDVEAAVALGADAGQVHRVDRLRFGWERLQATGALQARTDAPMEVAVAVDAHDVTDPAAPASAPASALPHWAAHATLQGPLAGLALAANLRGEASADGRRPAPQVDLAARVTPFGALPLSDITLHTNELDLAALSARAPTTRLSGDLRLAATKPAALDAELRNLAPRPWSDHGLPFSELSAKLEAPWSGESISVPALRIALHDGRAAAGELRAHGGWAGPKAQVQLDLDQVQLARLDERFGAWRLSGPLHAQLENLPSPKSLWGGPAEPAHVAASGAAAASATSAPFPPQAGAIAHAASALAAAVLPASAPAWTAQVDGRITGIAPPLAPGRNAVVPPPMTVDLDALVRADAAEIKTFALKAGTASASIKGAAHRAVNGTWQGEAHALWTQLDPGAWWRLADSGPLRTGPNLLNGKLDLELASAPPTWEGLAAVRARVDATLAASQLAGLPLEGKASVNAMSAPWTLAADLRNGDNQAHAEGVLDPAALARGLLDAIASLRLKVDAPAVASLAPLSPGRWPTRGSAHFEAHVDGALGGLDAKLAGRRAAGAHPLKLVTQGELADWSGPAVRLDKLHWDAEASTDPQAPLAAKVVVEEAVWGTTHIAVARAELSGTLAEHTLRLRGNAPVSPPEWLANLAGIGTFPSTRLDAQIQGRWRPGATDGPELQEHVAQLELRPSSRLSAAAGAASAALATLAAVEPPTSGPPSLGPLASPLPRPSSSPAGASAPAPAAASAPSGAASSPRPRRAAWLHVEPFDVSASRDAAGRWQTLALGPGRIDFAGLTLAWQPSHWTAPVAPGASAHWAFDAELANFYFAQVMARAEPEMGWHGDLQLNAKVHAAFDGQWHVDAAVARVGGDLAVVKDVATPGATTQSLGLTTIVMHLTAEGAHWRAETDAAGTRLGDLVGRFSFEAPSPASLPGAQSPLAGNLRVHVADLNVWGAWLPPGWRLAGRAQADVSLAGRLGAPDVTGRFTAQALEVRNALEGVYARDGVVDIDLQGDRAHIRTFRLVGGNGELTLSGGAQLGAQPVARLNIEAHQFQLLGRIDRRLVTSGSASVRLAADTLQVEGKLGIDEGLFDLTRGNAPTLDADVDMKTPGPTAGEALPEAEAGEPPTKAARATTLALGVDLGEKLRLKGRGIDTLLRGALQITAPGGHLTVKGTISTANGTYKAYGQNLEVTRGVLNFTGPVDDPRLDILATRPNLDVLVGVAITGTALNPHVRLYSEPEMPESDKLTWLMLGRAPEGVGSADTALLQQAAIALLAGENAPPDDTLFKQLGLTDLSFRQQEDASSSSGRETFVTVGRQISRRVYVAYERGVSQTTGNWQLIYRIAQRLTVRAQSGEDNALDVIWTWRWN